jgi:hypothetical protein
MGNIRGSGIQNPLPPGNGESRKGEGETHWDLIPKKRPLKRFPQGGCIIRLQKNNTPMGGCVTFATIFFKKMFRRLFFFGGRFNFALKAL